MYCLEISQCSLILHFVTVLSRCHSQECAALNDSLLIVLSCCLLWAEEKNLLYIVIFPVFWMTFHSSWRNCLTENVCTPVRRVLELIRVLLEFTPISFIRFYVLCFLNWIKRAAKFYICLVEHLDPWVILLSSDFTHILYHRLLQGLVLQDREGGAIVKVSLFPRREERRSHCA
jgi:hypothetical protein